MTITNVIDKVKEAANSVTGLYAKCCFLYELGENENYPLAVLIPPKGETLLHSDEDTYDIELWLMQLLPQSSTDDRDDIWEDLQEYGWDILKYLDNSANQKSGESYYLARPVEIRFEPVNAYGKDRTPAVVFTFRIKVLNCK